MIVKKLFLATAVQRQKVPNGLLRRTCLLVQHVERLYGVLRGRLLGYTLMLEKLPQGHGDLYHDCTNSVLVLERDGVPEQRKLTLSKENPRVQDCRLQ